MNETLNTIANRRSIRSFEPTTISDNDLKIALFTLLMRLFENEIKYVYN